MAYHMYARVAVVNVALLAIFGKGSSRRIYRALWYHQVPSSMRENTLHSGYDERARGKSAVDTGWISMLYKGMSAIAKQALVSRSVVLLGQTGQGIRPLGR